MLYHANRAIDTHAQPAIIRAPRRSSRESTAINSSSVLDGDEDTAIPSTAQEEDPSPVLNENFEDQVDAEDAAQLDPQEEAGTLAMDTVQPSTVLDNHGSTEKEADQSAMEGAEPSANRQNISDIPDGPEPSRTFSRMRKSRSFHSAFDKIVDHDLTATEPVTRSGGQAVHRRKTHGNPYGASHTMLWRHITAVMDLIHHPFTRTGDRSDLSCELIVVFSG